MATASRSWRSTAGAGAGSLRASATPARMAAIATAITSTRMSFLCGNVPLRSGTRLLLQRRRHGQQLAPRQVARDLHRVGRVLDVEDRAVAHPGAGRLAGEGARPEHRLAVSKRRMLVELARDRVAYAAGPRPLRHREPVVAAVVVQVHLVVGQLRVVCRDQGAVSYTHLRAHET